MTGVLFEHLFHPADLFSEGFGLALLKFPEVYQPQSKIQNLLRRRASSLRFRYRPLPEIWRPFRS